MKKPVKTIALVIALLLAGAYSYLSNEGSLDQASSLTSAAGVDAIGRAYQNQERGVQVRGEGIVTRMLSDDKDGSRHQRFILRLRGGQSLLVAHNIDLAPRLSPLREGDRVEFYGEYEWNPKGGVIHWTHHDPGGRHVGGWLKHSGRTYD